MNAQQFIDHLSEVALEGVFNPYKDQCDVHDHLQSPAIRRLNLYHYLDAVARDNLHSVWLGRDCGYRGGRRTGIALTDELNLETLNRRLNIDGLAKATASHSMKERTATEVWKMICDVDAKVFLWNVFPFHPFEGENSMSNRKHSAREFNECRDLLHCLLEWLQPESIVTLGVDAYNTVRKLGFDATPARHPSYGGHIEFAEAIRKFYSEKNLYKCSTETQSLF